MKKFSLVGAMLATALPLLSGVRPAAAATSITVAAQAAGDKNPFVMSWADSADGKTTATDSKMAQKIHDLFGGVQFIITDKGDLVIGQVNGQNIQNLLPPAHAIDVNDGKGYYVVHLRANTVFLDGVIYRGSSDPTKGRARLTLLLIDAKGNSSSSYIEQPLTWATATPTPSPNPGTNPFGF